MATLTDVKTDSVTVQFPRGVERGAFFLFVITLAIMSAQSFRHADDLFITPHAFVSADVATTARTFATEGIFRLRGIPVNNNPPLAVSDAYTHWPPLLPASLSMVFRARGATEHVAHLYMLAIFVATAALVFLLGRAWMGLTAGALAGYFWLMLPVVLQFRDLVSQQALAMLFVVAALLAFERGRAQLGSLLLFLGVFSAWEAALVAPAMWLISRWLPHRRKQANHAMAATAAALIAIAGLFLCGDPRAVVDTIQTAAFYMGLSHVYSHSNLVQQMPLPLSEQLRLTLLNNVWMLGPLGLGAFLQLAISRPRGFIEKILPLAAPWIGWCLVMHNHTARHHFEFLIAAPAVALALAWLVTKSEMAQKKTATLQAAVFILLAALQPMILPHPHISDGYDPTRLVEFGRSIKALTPPGSIVMAPLVSSVPLYYSDRHIVRGIDSPQAAIEALPELHRTYPNSPVYLAIPPFLREGFKMEGAQPAGATAEAILFKIE